MKHALGYYYGEEEDGKFVIHQYCVCDQLFIGASEESYDDAMSKVLKKFTDHKGSSGPCPDGDDY